MSDNLDFSIFLEYQLRLVPTHTSTYDPNTGQYICSCFRKEKCNAPGKHAIFRNWINTSIAPNTPETIELIKNATCNFGIATGVLQHNPSLQHVVIDVDYPVGMSHPLVARLPHTLTVATNNLGLHFHYFLPSSEDIRNVSTGIIDVRAKGGLVSILQHQDTRSHPL